jgi:c(7)-type cytochrome triheme protein
MRVRQFATFFSSFLLVFTVLAFAQAKKAPGPLTVPSKYGAVTFDHASHVKAAKNDCKTCHDKLWPQDAKAPVKFKGGAMHKDAVAAKSSCATCHVAGGTSFEPKGNCTKCHQKGGAKS